MRYFANVLQRGAVKYNDYPFTVGEPAVPDRFTLVGEAYPHGRDAQGRAARRLRIGRDDLPGWWVIVDREFFPL